MASRQRNVQRTARQSIGSRNVEAKKDAEAIPKASAIAPQAGASTPPEPRSPDSVLTLQRTLGNQRVQSLLEIQRQLSTNQGGKPLPQPVQAKMESSFGADFSDVRVHEGSGPSSFGALAYTQGNDIHFAPGLYSPESASGQQLLGHELTHVVQQRAGRAQGLQGKGTTINVNRALEAEADEMGTRAARGEPAHVPGANAGQNIQQSVIQPKMGFELELMVLVDIDGRPPPEKTFLGTYGAENLELQVDHNGDVAGPTPRRAADSNFWVATSLPAPMAPLAPHQMRQFGAYDLPQGQGWQTRVGLAAGAAPAVDTRTGLASTMLDPVNWQQRTNRHRFARPPAVSDIGMNNAQLVILDGLIPQYDVEKTNWEAVRAAAVLNQIIAAATAWLAANNNPPSNWHPFKKARYNRGRAKIQTLLNEANAHHAFWTNPANQNPPAGLERQYRRPTPANPNPAWRNRHPIAGAGNEEYASILEIVTRPYEPETVAGRAGLIAAMTEADQLAQAIENQTGNFANRIAFNTIPNANILNPLTHVGNAGPTRNPQRTDASIQSTFAVDLTQLPSLMRSTVAFGAPQQLFGLKHQGDVMASMTNPHTIHRAEQEMSRGAVNATRVINDVKAQIGGGAPSFVNLRGLVTLICQYLQLGKYWDPGGVQVLDKNLTDLLSRTDLSQIYQNAVPQAEKNWLQASPAHLNFLIGRIFHYTQRTPASVLLNNPNENRAPGGAPQFAITCQQFVNNIFTQGSDGITPHFGGFQQRPVEDIDPTGTQRPGEGIGGAAHRMAPVFELRNMMPKMVGDRFPRTDWVNLASYMAEMINLLNARTQAQATRDVRIDEQQQLGGPTTAAVGATLPAW